MTQLKYIQLADALRRRILDGTYPPKGRLPSENQLTRDFGYSRQTVRQAMAILESEGLAERRRGSGTYVRASARVRERTHNVAVLTTYIGEYIFPAILKGIDEVLSARGYTSMVAATHNRVDDERRVLSELMQKPIDGLLVEGTKTALPNPNLDLYRRLYDAGLPVVFLNGYYPDLTAPVYVVSDDRQGGMEAARLLLRQGCRRIAGVFKGDDIQGHRRYAGYTAALREAGLEVSDDRILWYATETRDEMIAAHAARCVQGCDGVVCYNDETALRVIAALKQAGQRVPQDVRVVSFDRSAYARLSAEPFPSLYNSKEQLGRLAAEKLLDLIDGKKAAGAVLPWTAE